MAQYRTDRTRVETIINRSFSINRNLLQCPPSVRGAPITVETLLQRNRMVTTRRNDTGNVCATVKPCVRYCWCVFGEKNLIPEVKLVSPVVNSLLKYNRIVHNALVCPCKVFFSIQWTCAQSSVVCDERRRTAGRSGFATSPDGFVRIAGRESDESLLVK